MGSGAATGQLETDTVVTARNRNRRHQESFIVHQLVRQPTLVGYYNNRVAILLCEPLTRTIVY